MFINVFAPEILNVQNTCDTALVYSARCLRLLELLGAAAAGSKTGSLVVKAQYTLGTKRSEAEVIYTASLVQATLIICVFSSRWIVVWNDETPTHDMDVNII